MRLASGDSGGPAGLRVPAQRRHATPAADCALAVAPGSPVARHYTRLGDAAPAGSSEAALGRFFSQIGQPGSSLAQWFAAIFLEYDIAAVAPEQRPPPGVFLRLRRASESVAGEPNSRQRAPEQAVNSVVAAVGWAQQERERAAAVRVFDAPPPGGEIAHIGAMPVVGPAPSASLPTAWTSQASSLSCPGWTGAARWEKSRRFCERRGAGYARLGVAMQVSARGVSLGIGLELGPVGDESAGSLGAWYGAGRADWQPLVATLEREGGCLPVKASGILAWPMRENVYAPHGPRLIYRGINHVKLTVAEGAVTAKAYGGLSCIPVG